MAIEPGQRLLHYRLVEKLGEGGMGPVDVSSMVQNDRATLPGSRGGSGLRQAGAA